MQGNGTYQGWETPSYVIHVSPQDVIELRLALIYLRQLTGDKNMFSRKWDTLVEQMDATDATGFGFGRHETDVIEDVI